MIDATAVKATRIELLRFSTPQMRTFHWSWMAVFVSFFAGFAVAPLAPVIKAEFGLSKNQIGDRDRRRGRERRRGGRGPGRKQRVFLLSREQATSGVIALCQHVPRGALGVAVPRKPSRAGRAFSR